MSHAGQLSTTSSSSSRRSICPSSVGTGSVAASNLASSTTVRSKRGRLARGRGRNGPLPEDAVGCSGTSLPRRDVTAHAIRRDTRIIDEQLAAVLTLIADHDEVYGWPELKMCRTRIDIAKERTDAIRERLDQRPP